ncbi:hypothetical protein PILCRDRAFT_691660 [Piloderma croceum F 1598]|uniref:Uncharacterized protein n=1 Tax=Piloderma croceum (strain F 1598) TaxID=765440 RepID=A0A0C3BBZ8_PILCF|nr:hypothetical protein PILCRDRAFT_691660 [Piloderma croceum F 1598]
MGPGRRGISPCASISDQMRLESVCSTPSLLVVRYVLSTSMVFLLSKPQKVR